MSSFVTASASLSFYFFKIPHLFPSISRSPIHTLLIPRPPYAPFVSTLSTLSTLLPLSLYLFPDKVAFAPIPLSHSFVCSIAFVPLSLSLLRLHLFSVFITHPLIRHAYVSVSRSESFILPLSRPFTLSLSLRTRARAGQQQQLSLVYRAGIIYL